MYGVEEDLDPGQASESRVSQENLGLGKTSKELCDSRVEEPDLRTDLEGGMYQTTTGEQSSRNQIQGYQRGVSMGLTILEDSSNPRNHQYGILNHLFRGFQGWWGGVIE